MIWCLKKQRLRNPCVVTRNRSYVWATLGFFIRTVRSARCCIFVPSGPPHQWRARALRAPRHARFGVRDARFGAQVRAACQAREARAARSGTELVPLARRTPRIATSSLQACFQQAESIPSSSMCVAATQRCRSPTFDSRPRVPFGGTTGKNCGPSQTAQFLRAAV